MACGEEAAEPEGEEAVEELEEEGAELREAVLTDREGSTCVDEVSGCEAESALLLLPSELSTAESEDVEEEDVEEEDESEETEDEVDEDEDEEEADVDEEEDEDEVDEAAEDEEVEEAAADELALEEDDEDADDVPVGVSGGDVDGEEEADRFSRADVSSDLPFAKNPFELLLLSLLALVALSSLCPLGEAGCDDTGVAADELEGDLTDGETGVAMVRSSGVGLLDLGCT